MRVSSFRRSLALKKRPGFTRLGKVSAFLLFPDHLAIPPDFKNPAAAADQFDLLTGRFLDFSRHPVGFGTIVSLLTVFDLNGHAGTIAIFKRVTIENWDRMAPPEPRS